MVTHLPARADIRCYLGEKKNISTGQLLTSSQPGIQGAAPGVEQDPFPSSIPIPTTHQRSTRCSELGAEPNWESRGSIHPSIPQHRDEATTSCISSRVGFFFLEVQTSPGPREEPPLSPLNLPEDVLLPQPHPSSSNYGLSPPGEATSARSRLIRVPELHSRSHLGREGG